MSISFIYTEDRNEVYLEYQVTGNFDSKWVVKVLKEKKEVKIRRVFFFTKKDLLEEKSDPEDGYYIFKFSKIQGDYYKILNRNLNIDHDIFFFAEFQMIPKYFMNTQASNPSIFSNIQKICDEDIYIGGSHESSIPKEDFQLLIENFPTRPETQVYSQSKISRLLREYLFTMKDAESQFQKFLQKKERESCSTCQ